MAEDRWIMHGLDIDDPGCIRTAAQLEDYIEQVGFLPLFRIGIPEFSVLPPFCLGFLTVA